MIDWISDAHSPGYTEYSQGRIQQSYSWQVKLCTDCRYPHLGRQLVRKMTQQLWSVQQRAAWYVLLLHDLHVPLLPTDTSWLA